MGRLQGRPNVKPLVFRFTQKTYVYTHMLKLVRLPPNTQLHNLPHVWCHKAFFIMYMLSKCQITCNKCLFPLVIILQYRLEVNHRGVTLHRWGVMWYWLLEFVAGIHFFFLNVRYKHVGQRDSVGNRFFQRFFPVSTYGVQEILCKMPLTAACCDSFI